MPTKGNPNIRDIAGKGRKSRADQKFFFRIGETLRVTRDSYNIVIAELYTAESSGKRYQLNKGFFATVEGVCTGLKSYGASSEEIASFQKRTTGVTSDYKNGKLVIETPEDIIYDEHDILSDTDKSNNEDDGDNDDGPTESE
jgi:hypothetical protein